MRVAIYKTDSQGRIDRILEAPDDQIAGNVQSGEAYLDIGASEVSDATHRVVSGAITARPLFSSVATFDTTTITANGTAQASLGPSLPNPTEVRIVGPDVTGAPTTGNVTDGVFRLRTTVPGEYLIELKAWPYQDASYKVVAQ